MQMDVCKIANGLYQFTAIDDCSRYQVVAVHPRKTAKYTLAFLDQVVEEMPFSIQRIQTDRGQEFFTYKVQDQLRAWSVKFRPIKARSPHLNGKVERVQRPALEEFWPTVERLIHSSKPSLPNGSTSTTGRDLTTVSVGWRRSTAYASGTVSRLPSLYSLYTRF